MSEQEARDILKNYRETYDDTGEQYGFIIQDYCGKDGETYLFRCKMEGVDYDALDGVNSNLPLMGVYPDGSVLTIPE